MKALDVTAAVLLVVGGINWGLVGLLEFDLVAFIAGGLSFGETNVFSRMIYFLVGAAGIYQAASVRAIQHRWGLAGAPRNAHPVA